MLDLLYLHFSYPFSLIVKRSSAANRNIVVKLHWDFDTAVD